MENDASSIALPSSWNFRRKKPTDEEDAIPQEHVQEEVDREPSSKHDKEMVQLMGQQRSLDESEASGLTRSTRV